MRPTPPTAQRAPMPPRAPKRPTPPTLSGLRCLQGLRVVPRDRGLQGVRGAGSGSHRLRPAGSAADSTGSRSRRQRGRLHGLRSAGSAADSTGSGSAGSAADSTGSGSAGSAADSTGSGSAGSAADSTGSGSTGSAADSTGSGSTGSAADSTGSGLRRQRGRLRGLRFHRQRGRLHGLERGLLVGVGLHEPRREALQLFHLRRRRGARPPRQPSAAGVGAATGSASPTPGSSPKLRSSMLKSSSTAYSCTGGRPGRDLGREGVAPKEAQALVGDQGARPEHPHHRVEGLRLFEGAEVHEVRQRDRRLAQVHQTGLILGTGQGRAAGQGEGAGPREEGQDPLPQGQQAVDEGGRVVPDLDVGDEHRVHRSVGGRLGGQL